MVFVDVCCWEHDFLYLFSAGFMDGLQCGKRICHTAALAAGFYVHSNQAVFSFFIKKFSSLEKLILLKLQAERVVGFYVKDNVFFCKRKYSLLYYNSSFVFVSFFLYRNVSG